jgi:ABC-type Fe3+-hydroxamate transport system substrate-binding protein
VPSGCRNDRGYSSREWDDPLISAIGWVSEIIDIAGGADIFADRVNQAAAKDRVVTIEEVVTREPELIIGSSCGKKFRPERVMARPGFDRTPAVQRQDKVVTDLAARSRCPDRWSCRASKDHRAVDIALIGLAPPGLKRRHRTRH